MTAQITLAGCIIFDSENKLYLLHRNTPGRVQWETPGGKIEPGENPEETAVREIAEELGVRVKIIRQLGEKEFKEDVYTMKYFWFLARITRGIPKAVESKHDLLKSFSWEELRQMRAELSPNTVNLLSEYLAGHISL